MESDRRESFLARCGLLLSNLCKACFVAKALAASGNGEPLGSASVHTETMRVTRRTI